VRGAGASGGRVSRVQHSWIRRHILQGKRKMHSSLFLGNVQPRSTASIQGCRDPLIKLDGLAFSLRTLELKLVLEGSYSC
jgi:hypothetical protein